MNFQKVVSELNVKYPGKNVVVEDDGEYQEIVVELEPTADNPEKSLALAVVGKSKPHYHNKTIEIYEAIRGRLTVNIEGKDHVLNEGERITIEPGKVHYAQGEETWFNTHSTPGWSPDDHIFVGL